MHENKLAHSPSDWLYKLFSDRAIAIQQREVRCEMRLTEFEPGFLHRSTKSLLKLSQCRNTITSAQDKRMVARSADKTHRAIEHDLKRRSHCSGTSSFARHC